MTFTSSIACMMATDMNRRDREGRVAARFPVAWPVKLANGAGRTRDISATGMYLESDVAVIPNELIHFSVMLPQRGGLAEQLRCEGRAVRVEWYESGWFGVGVALLWFRFGSLAA